MCAIIEWLCVQRERKRMHQCVLATTEWLCVQRERERKRRLQCVLSLNVVCVKRKRRHHSDMVMDVCMVNIELAETAAVSDGTSSVRHNQTVLYVHHLGGYSKRAIKATVTHLESHATNAQ